MDPKHAAAIVAWIQARLGADPDYKVLRVRSDGPHIVIEKMGAAGTTPVPKAAFMAISGDRYGLCAPKKSGGWDTRALQVGTVDEVLSALMGLHSFLLVFD
jgi:hypothetical protein